MIEENIINIMSVRELNFFRIFVLSFVTYWILLNNCIIISFFSNNSVANFHFEAQKDQKKLNYEHFHEIDGYKRNEVPKFESCADGVFGALCDQKCKCSPFTECDEGVWGDGSCQCILGMELHCGILPRTFQHSNSFLKALNGISENWNVRFYNLANFYLASDPSTQRKKRKVKQSAIVNFAPLPPRKFITSKKNIKSGFADIQMIDINFWNKAGLSTNNSLILHLEECFKGEGDGVCLPEIEGINKALEEFLSGAKLPPDVIPYSYNYGGFQFFKWSGQLGDGRAVNLGHVVVRESDVRESERNKKRIEDDVVRKTKLDHSCQESSSLIPFSLLEVNIKGVGPTPFSRSGDGRASLELLSREYLGSLCLRGLGIPVVQSVSLLSLEDEYVWRDEFYSSNFQQHAKKLPAGILVRVSPTFLRFGSFQLAAVDRGTKGLEELSDYFYILTKYSSDTALLKLHEERVNRYHKKNCDDFYSNSSNWFPSPPEWYKLPLNKKLELILKYVTISSSLLCAKWQSRGFVHGVLNSDNLWMSGVTGDLNVFGFLTKYKEDFVANYIDSDGVYSFQKQPEALYWNIVKLSEAFTGQLEQIREQNTNGSNSKNSYNNNGKTPGWLSVKKAEEIVKTFNQSFQSDLLDQYRIKLGIYDDKYREVQLQGQKQKRELNENTKDVENLIQMWILWIKKSGADFHISWRQLPEAMLFVESDIFYENDRVISIFSRNLTINKASKYLEMATYSCLEGKYRKIPIYSDCSIEIHNLTQKIIFALEKLLFNEWKKLRKIKNGDIENNSIKNEFYIWKKEVWVQKMRQTNPRYVFRSSAISRVIKESIIYSKSKKKDRMSMFKQVSDLLEYPFDHESWIINSEGKTNKEYSEAQEMLSVPNEQDNNFQTSCGIQ